jgi:endonuclease YncB( thermonuclease family)
MIEADRKNVGEILISEGLVRTKGVTPKLPSGEKGKDYMQRLDDLEGQAQQKRVGAWATSTPEKTETTPAAAKIL